MYSTTNSLAVIFPLQERRFFYLDDAVIFPTAAVATAASPSDSWAPVKVLVHIKDDRVIDVEHWED